ncbi:hypothetical protein M3765_24180 [Streptomyces thermoviolaceus]|jgi:dehydratase|uniref:Dehydratase n=1 Tax=Streptomyces thermoviolaceus subsp. thermoviolaceus TaxID=66860 RepID=A0ABX0YZ75_STRTL|nr:hypothetical protein [Streptomyces thermoviolaceus]MCM3267041.1 hypothetical protein [Streptomyces thermoviolaceus]NJP16358.1 hypothetical protein [Streptomyces thermoviolaceus subsp. thermoviolaceus]WTD48918.1 hypothetical protein OG899_16200 [Streptomyces thermoviolaceus]GHB08590.1 hypothetical protein GCM10010512_45210 [Streptomyces thermoviolaceus subsp. thermoviolaceus]
MAQARLVRRALATVTAVAAAALAAGGPQAAAADTALSNPYACQVNTTQGLPYALGFTASAPDKVKRGATFTAEITPAPITPNPSHNDYSYDLVLRLRLPDNAELRQYQLTGGDTPATATVDGDELVLRAPGPFPAAVAFQLPTVRLTLKATTRGSVTTEPGGSGYDAYGFGWDFIPSANEAPHVPTPSTLRCYPNPAQTLTSTTVK